MNRKTSYSGKEEHRYSAFDTAIYTISFKDRTEKELRTKLTQKGYDEKETELAIERLIDYGYVSDRRYAEMYIRQQHTKKGYRLLKRELIEKGIDRELVEELYDSLNVDEEQLLEKVFQKRYSGADLNDEKTYRKAFSYLVRRGFSTEGVRRILAKYKNS